MMFILLLGRWLGARTRRRTSSPVEADSRDSSKESHEIPENNAVVALARAESEILAKIGHQSRDPSPPIVNRLEDLSPSRIDTPENLDSENPLKG